MKKMKLRINKEYEIDAETEEEAMENLEEQFGRENNTAENEFWAEIEVVEEALSEEEIDELSLQGLHFEDFKEERGKICKNHKFRYFKAVYELKEVKEITENEE
jgi:hypothetical protein